MCHFPELFITNLCKNPQISEVHPPRSLAIKIHLKCDEWVIELYLVISCLRGQRLRMSHPYLEMPRSSFSFTMLNLGSVSWSSFCFSSIFSSIFWRSLSKRFWKNKRTQALYEKRVLNICLSLSVMNVISNMTGNPSVLMGDEIWL